MNSSNIENIIFVASGKGGVGKSMVASNLAIAMARNGFATGLFDADIFGPSVPLSMGMTNQKPLVHTQGDKQVFEPLINFGVKMMSLGFLVAPNDAVIWRGPAASNALTQMLEGTNWGALDYMVVDLPPGTSDIALTLSQKLPRARAIIVTSPQKMAVADARKAARMFLNDGIRIAISGVVENMSWFTPAPHPGEKYYLFGKDGGKALADELGVPLLAQIPLVDDVCEKSDEGKPVFTSADKSLTTLFEKLAETLARPTPASHADL